MTATKKTPLPAILLANDLLDGDVVFRTALGWSRDPSEALVAEDEATAARLEEEARAAFARQEVVDAYLVDVTRDSNGVPVPNHFRERFKVKGPSNRPDLGKQAEFSPSMTAGRTAEDRAPEETDSHIATLPVFWMRVLSGLLLLILGGFTLIWFLNAKAGDGIQWQIFFVAFAVGLVAQLVDGALGMAYGVTSNSLLLASGLPPAQATATVHIAEAFTTAASGLSHWRLGNIDKRLFRRLVIPGVLGAVAGALLVTSVNATVLRPIISAYLLLMGLYIIYRAFRTIRRNAVPDGRLIPLAMVGGFVDSVGGGGWGPIVTTTMLGSGHEPRTTIGSVNATEFFVTLASGFSFVLLIGINHVESVLGLILGGILMAPFAARLSGKLDRRVLMVAVGTLISALSLWTLSRALGF